jgi:hypothetical protein
MGAGRSRLSRRRFTRSCHRPHHAHASFEAQTWELPRRGFVQRLDSDIDAVGQVALNALSSVLLRPRYLVRQSVGLSRSWARVARRRWYATAAPPL